MNDPDELRPAVVVTGASGGIGRAIAKVVAREVEAVVLVARSADSLAAAAEEVRQEGSEALVLALDLTEPGASYEVEKFLVTNSRFCDVLINNAGCGLLGATGELPLKRQLAIIDLNIRALTDLTLRFLPGMLARRRGGILNVSSIASYLPGPNMALYFASKAYVRSFSEAVAEEVRGTGVNVTCVAPGPVGTQFFVRAGANKARLFKLLPKMTTEQVAMRSWQAFKRGRRLVIPGIVANLTALVATHVPHRFSLPFVAGLLGGGVSTSHPD